MHSYIFRTDSLRPAAASIIEYGETVTRIEAITAHRISHAEYTAETGR